MRPIWLGLLLALMAPSLCAAHVRMSPAFGPSGSSYTGAVVVGHGCKGSATRAVSMELPATLAPRVGAPPGWTVEAKAEGAVVSVTWRGEAGAQSSLALPVSLTLPKTPGPIFLPVQQVCAVGEESWSQIPTPGQDPQGLTRPAPVIRVGASADGAAEDMGSMEGMAHPPSPHR